jgi:hypothetical protein
VVAIADGIATAAVSERATVEKVLKSIKLIELYIRIGKGVVPLSQEAVPTALNVIQRLIIKKTHRFGEFKHYEVLFRKSQSPPLSLFGFAHL